MAKIVTPLTLSKIKAAKARDKMYKLSDGGGLALWVYPTGAKSWKLSFVQDGKQQTLTLGRYPDYTLTEAREWRDGLRRKMAHGENVLEKKMRDDLLFKSVALDWFARWSPDKAGKYAVQVLSSLERWVFPKIGARDIRDLKTVDVVECLRLMESHGIADLLRKTKNNLNMIFVHAASLGLIESNPVSVVSLKSFRRGESRNMAALMPSDLPRLVDFLEQRGEFAPRGRRLQMHAVTRLCIYWLLLTMTRVQEAALMEWSELDFDAGLWRIPAARKKERREHVVPLSSAMRWVLEQARDLNVNGRYVFESADFRSHINKESPRVVMQRAGLETTAHGLRSLARTYLREVLKVDNDVAEKLLAHSLGTKTQTAYNRSELLKERADALEAFGRDVLALVGKKQTA